MLRVDGEVSRDGAGHDRALDPHRLRMQRCDADELAVRLGSCRDDERWAARIPLVVLLVARRREVVQDVRAELEDLRAVPAWLGEETS